MRSFSNIMTNFAGNLHLLVDSIQSLLRLFYSLFSKASCENEKKCCIFAPEIEYL